MKLSDYVIDFLVRKGVTHLFGISGGAAVHLFDSAARHPGMNYVCGQHEQSSAMSADGYARVTGKLGVAVTTSGPGATNLLTGVCCSYYDSVPTLLITGQVATHRLKGERPVRQVGFQETDVISIFKSVTKYAGQIRDPLTIRYHLEKACFLAFDRRPGSVLIDIPDDLQRAEVHHEQMEGFSPPAGNDGRDSTVTMEDLRSLLDTAERPVLVLGGGLSTPRLGPELEQFIDSLGFPVVMTWAGLDLIPDGHPLRVGPFGVYGPRLGNFVVQNADLLLCIGTRLSQNVTGGILPSFARKARIVMVDVCRGEMDKFDGRGIDVLLRIERRAADFLADAVEALRGRERPDISGWHSKIAHWRHTLPMDRPGPADDKAGFVDAYDFIDELSRHLPNDDTILVDTGGNLTWTCNGVRLRRGQRLISAWNNTPMGYALPAAIGAAYGTGRPVTCIIGDGGLMLCLSELATLAAHRLPVRVILFNNHGHGIQKQTLETWLQGRYEGVDAASGLAFTDFVKVAAAMGLKTMTIDRSSDMKSVLSRLYECDEPVLCNVEINPSQKLYPVLKFGAPLESQLPAMDQRTIEEEMLIEPFKGATDVGARGSAGV